MIKGAVQEYQEIVKKSHQHALDGAGSAIANKYSGNQTGQGNKKPGQADAGGQKSGGLISKLKQKAAVFTGGSSSSTDTVSASSKNDEKDKEMASSWGYEGKLTSMPSTFPMNKY
jgi:hypothetical protein